MPLHFTAARSSRIRKPSAKKPPPSPFSRHTRKKTSQVRTKTKIVADSEGSDHDFAQERLPDIAHVPYLAYSTPPNELAFRSVTDAVQRIRSIMFSPLPERAGMRSTRISEVLNFQRSMPPIVSLAHVHAVVGSSTKTEREIAAAVEAGILRRVVVPVRGTGPSGVGEGLVLGAEWEDRVRKDAGVEGDVKGWPFRVDR